MKVLLAVCVAVLAMAGVAQASSSAWVRGSSYMITEEEASDFLEQAMDHAYCTGIPRLGHRGEFPYEEFRVFDCSVELNDEFCSDDRWRAVKGKRRGMYSMKLVRHGDCF
jgi:hypothetical protein